MPKKIKSSKAVLNFKGLPLLSQQKKILSWFIDMDEVSSILNNGGVVEENQVTVIPSEIPMDCLNSEINFNVVKHLFSEDAWKLVENVLAVKRQLSK